MSGVVDAEPSTGLRAPHPVAAWVRWALIVWWLLSAAAVVGFGERASTLPDLLAAVDAGQVSKVQVVGTLPPGAEGFVTQDVRWRQGGFAHYAEVRYTSPGNTQDPATDGPPDGQAAVDTTSVDVATAVHQHRADVRVQVSPTSSSTSTSNIWGWRMPSLVGGFILLGVLCSLYLVTVGPAPWRATRWAWAWVILFGAPVGTLAFALLSGPTPLVPAPRDRARRLTGGWAFLIMAVVGGRFTQQS